MNHGFKLKSYLTRVLGDKIEGISVSSMTNFRWRNFLYSSVATLFIDAGIESKNSPISENRSCLTNFLLINRLDIELAMILDNKFLKIQTFFSVSFRTKAKAYKLQNGGWDCWVFYSNVNKQKLSRKVKVIDLRLKSFFHRLKIWQSFLKIFISNLC